MSQYAHLVLLYLPFAPMREQKLSVLRPAGMLSAAGVDVLAARHYVFEQGSHTVGQ